MMTLKIYDNAFNSIGVLTESDFDDLSYRQVKMEIGDASFVVKVENEKITPTLLKHYNFVEIYSGNTLKWSGYIIRKSVKLNTINVTCKEIGGLLKKRLVGDPYVMNGAVNTLLTTLFNSINSDHDTFISIGSIQVQTAINSTFTRESVWSILQKIADLTSTEFYISPDRKLYFASSLGQDRSDSVSFEYNTKQIAKANIVSFQVDDDGEPIISKAYGKSNSLSSTQSDSGLLAEYGVLEEFDNFRVANTQGDLDKFTQSKIREEVYSPQLNLLPYQTKTSIAEAVTTVDKQVNFNGSIGCAIVKNKGDLVTLGDLENASYSIELEFRSIVKKDQSLTEKWVPYSTEPYPWAIRGPLPSDGRIAIGIYKGTGGIGVGVSATDKDYADGAWHKLVMVRDKINNKLKIYTDGALRNQTDDTLDMSLATSGDISIGRRFPYMEANQFDGNIRGFRIYKRALSDQEVLEHNTGVYSNENGLLVNLPMNDGVGSDLVDLSGNENKGKLTGVNWENVYEYPDYYVTRFAGVNGYVHIKVSDRLKAIGSSGHQTYSAVVRFRTTKNSDMILLSTNNISTSLPVMIRLHNNVFQSYYTYNGVAPFVSTNTVNYADGKWHTGVIVRDKGTGKFTVYFDGVQVDQRDDTSTDDVSNAGGGVLGNCYSDGSNNDPFQGDIALVRIYERALTSAEAMDIHNQKTIAPDNVILDLPLDEGTGTTSNDKSGNSSDAIFYRDVSFARNSDVSLAPQYEKVVSRISSDNFDVFDLVKVRLYNKFIDIDDTFQVVEKSVKYNKGYIEISVRINTTPYELAHKLKEIDDAIKLLEIKV